MRTRGASLVRYLVVGSAIAGASAIGIVILATALGFHPVVAAATIGVLGNLVGFVANREWSFLATHDRPLRQLLRYSAVSLAAILASVGLFAMLTEVAGLHYVLASVCVSAVFGATNFFAHYHWSFAERAPAGRGS